MEGFEKSLAFRGRLLSCSHVYWQLYFTQKYLDISLSCYLEFQLSDMHCIVRNVIVICYHACLHGYSVKIGIVTYGAIAS